MTQLQPFVGADSLRKAQALFLTNLEDAKKILLFSRFVYYTTDFAKSCRAACIYNNSFY